LSATTDPRLLPPPQLTAPLETLRPNADPANNVAVAPPANSLVQTPDAATGPEHASQDASATDGPALAPPLNHWQQPTWTPSMGSLPPIGVNGWRLHGASHATAAPPPSLR
jgi:hypothetical protein